MSSATPSPSGHDADPRSAAVRRIGCVSYLNAKPLIEGLEGLLEPVVQFDVPSRLLEDLEAGRVDIALCPVIDFQQSHTPLEVVPVGGIGCKGPTLTVRLFSRVPFDQVAQVYADSDSHTSIALMRVILADRFGVTPRIVEYDAREQVANHRLIEPPPTMLLIGDKVVTNCPDESVYRHQLDLGQAWHELTGLPFVFAVWMARPGAALGDLPARLDAQRIANAHRINQIAEHHAPEHGWPVLLARQYLGELLRYAIGPDELTAMREFFARAHRLGLISRVRPLAIRSI